MNRVADACGISLRTVQRVNAEIKNNMENQKDLCDVENVEVANSSKGGCEEER